MGNLARDRVGRLLLVSMTALGCAYLPGATPPAHVVASRPAEATIAGSERHRLPSRYVDQVFSIDVWQPIGIPGPLPVVYVLDGNSTFAMTVQMVGPMIFAGEIPPMIVVGVGYEVESPLEVVALRTRDLLPTDVEGFAERMAEQGFPLPEGVRPGGAEAFRSFLESELKPFVESRYPIDREDETLVGDSYGGTFATWLLFGRSYAFDRYVIGSPVLAWDDELLFRAARAHAETNEALAVKLFLSSGEFEVDNGIRATTERMVRLLEEAEYEGLEMSSHVFPDETHTSVIGPTIGRGLRAVFGAWPVGW